MRRRRLIKRAIHKAGDTDASLSAGKQGRGWSMMNRIESVAQLLPAGFSL
ncbi:hypothetical protein [Agriterribacter sp.]|nr:hypothetical protein [Agriterribacter sp.]HRO44345.1 hypothetical protein [Agriterribacter sp.]HRQ16661.1 hypothetical protein [Agriterribacter sp.]